MRLTLVAALFLVGCSSGQDAAVTEDAGVEDTSSTVQCTAELVPTGILTPVQGCCHVGATLDEAGKRFSDGDPGPTCRGECIVGVTSEGDQELRCDCGAVEWNGIEHTGPGPCPAQEVCCIRGPGGLSPGPTCMKPEECVDCRPARSHPAVVVDCCRGDACRGTCYDAATKCRCGDAPGCGDGFECCPAPDGLGCLPEGTCAQGPCPEPPASAGAVATCCNYFTCQGTCESEHGVSFCKCAGENRACDADEECCLGPSRQANGQDTTCAPRGSCGE